jgi:DNA-binding XRE family transcriptional regulator
MPRRPKPLVKRPISARAKTPAVDKAAQPEPLSKNLRASFGKRLREERMASGLSPAQLAELTGVTRRHISRLEAGTENLTVETAAALAKHFGFALDLIWSPVRRIRGKST